MYFIVHKLYLNNTDGYNHYACCVRVSFLYIFFFIVLVFFFCSLPIYTIYIDKIKYAYYYTTPAENIITLYYINIKYNKTCTPCHYHYFTRISQ